MLSICVVNYNGERYLRETLTAVRGLEGEVGEVLVVDNGSTDGGPQLVQREFPDTKLVSLSRNEGAGHARNRGYELAEHDLVLFLDNDVAPAPDCLRLLSAALLERPEAALAMPAVLFASDPGVVQYDGATSHFLGLQNLEHSGLPYAEIDPSTRAIGSIVTACFLVDRRRWGQDPLFDERYFYIFEDHDLGIRARLWGHGILSVPQARCFHGEGTPGLSLRETGHYTPSRIYHTLRNRWLLVLKNYQLRSLVLLAPVLLLFEAFAFLGALKKGWIREWFGAHGWLLGHLPQILRARGHVQRRRTVADRELLTGGPIPFTDRLLQGRLEEVGRAILSTTCQWHWRLVRRFL